MRTIFAAILLAAGLSLAGVSVTTAAPVNGKAIAAAGQQTDQVTEVSGGCGRWRHRNRWGRCVRD